MKNKISSILMLFLPLLLLGCAEYIFYTLFQSLINGTIGDNLLMIIGLSVALMGIAFVFTKLMPKTKVQPPVLSQVEPTEPLPDRVTSEVNKSKTERYDQNNNLPNSDYSSEKSLKNKFSKK